MMSLDQWDWKPNAPEFVPGVAPAMMPGGMLGGIPGGSRDCGPTLGNIGCVGPFSISPIGMGSCPNNGPTLLAAAPQGPLLSNGPPQLPSGPVCSAVNGAVAFPMQGPLPGPLPGTVGLPPGGAACMIQPLNLADLPNGQLVQMGLQQSPPIHMQQCGASNGMAGLAMEAPGQIENLHAQYEWQMHHKDQKVKELQRRLGREEVERAQMQDAFERDREGLLRHLDELTSAVEKHGIQVGGGQRKGGRPSSSIDSKLEHLHSLLQDRHENTPARGGKASSSRAPAFSNSSRYEKGSAMGWKGKGPQTTQNYSQSKGNFSARGSHRLQEKTAPSIPSSARQENRVFFPADLVQHIHTESQSEDEGSQSPPECMDSRVAEEVEKTVKVVEKRVGCVISHRARQNLGILDENDALEALRRAEDLVQGGHGKDLSSVLQSVCRKIKRRSKMTDENSDATSRSGLRHPTSDDSTVGTTAPSSSASEVEGSRCGDDEKTPSDSKDAKTQAVAEHRRGAGGRPRLVAEHRHTSSALWTAGAWTMQRFERVARQDGFVLKEEDDVRGAWRLQIRMASLEPPIANDDMQVYCRWLHHRLQSVRQDLGLRSLRQLRTEVNFSKNNLGDDAVARLLQALQRSELHIASLNLTGNRLGVGAARHISDFLWEMPVAIHEVNLSHNEFDDDSALEILRLVADHPKYQPRKARDSARHGELQCPVWLRLDNNRIEKPRKLLRTLESELGSCICLARNRNVCGPHKCGWRGSQGHTLMHLYNFESQDSSASALAQPSSAANWRRDMSEQDRAAEQCSEEVLLNREVMCSDARTTASIVAPSTTVEEPRDKTVAVPMQPSGLSCAQGLSADVRLLSKLEAKRRPNSNSSSYPHLRGVPEVTPEPDGSAPHSLLHVAGRMPKLREASDEEAEESASPRADMKVKFKAPPKILQRGMAPPPEVVLRSNLETTEQVS
mmetsp:Transcript_1865/g.3298  ORF Transcript_1865/g.3298 Transcript_1865/m.3298 type:complete len:956 (-) Transcript_1865:67-2934(-)